MSKYLGQKQGQTMLKNVLFRALSRPQEDTPINQQTIAMAGYDSVDPSPEQRLIVSLIVVRIVDAGAAVSGEGNSAQARQMDKDSAIHFFLGGEYVAWCRDVGLDPGYVREMAESYWKRKGINNGR